MWLLTAMPHELFFNIPNSQTVLFSDRTLWAEHKPVWILKISSVVQKIPMFLCLKIGPEVGKVLNRDKEGNVTNEMALKKILNKVSFFVCSYLKTPRAINMKFGYILENRMLNPSTILHNTVSYHHSELICINCIIMTTFFHQSCKDSK